MVSWLVLLKRTPRILESFLSQSSWIHPRIFFSTKVTPKPCRFIHKYFARNYEVIDGLVWFIQKHEYIRVFSLNLRVINNEIIRLSQRLYLHRKSF